jgi:hypothetical protein
MFISKQHNTRSKFSGIEGSNDQNNTELQNFDLNDHKSQILKLAESKQSEIDNIEGFVKQMTDSGKTPAPFLLSMLSNMKEEKAKLIKMVNETDLISNLLNSNE